MSLFACVSIHQGHECFSDRSRGKQCAFMSLSALLTARNLTVTEWNSTTIDNALLQGDKMCLFALDNGLIPPDQLLLLDNLPTVVSFPEPSNEVRRTLNLIDIDYNTRSALKVSNAKSPIMMINTRSPIIVEPVEAQNNIELPSVVEPVEVQNNIELPSVVEPVEAQNINIELPSVVEPVEAQNKSELPSVVEPIEAQNNCQVWFITYGKDHQGLIIYSESEFDYPYYSIHSALMSTFTNSCILQYLHFLSRELNTN